LNNSGKTRKPLNLKITYLTVAKRLKGIYVLIIQINQTIQPKIGALGRLTFTEGLYAYVGSAQNNLELRVARHRRKEKRLFWHIDYLLNNEAAKVMAVYYKPGLKTEECKIASLIEANAQPIAGFGCSDCNCRSHLFRVQNFGFLRGRVKPLKAQNENAELAQRLVN
jgi:Uri superfamily endonuclease